MSSRTIAAGLGLLLCLALAACGGGAPPRNINNACALIEEKPSFYRAMKASQERWGIPVHVQMATIRQESSFDPNARTPYQWALGIIPMGRASSAYGFAQVIDSTWDDYRKGPGRWGADRDDIRDATDFIGWYMHGTSVQLGISPNDARAQYLAYHEGRAGYARGSYRSKAWLIDVANSVESRSRAYQQQLAACHR